jgi:hypothetical protein
MQEGMAAFRKCGNFALEFCALQRNLNVSASVLTPLAFPPLTSRRVRQHGRVFFGQHARSDIRPVTLGDTKVI